MQLCTVHKWGAPSIKIGFEASKLDLLTQDPSLTDRHIQMPEDHTLSVRHDLSSRPLIIPFISTTATRLHKLMIAVDLFP